MSPELTVPALWSLADVAAVEHAKSVVWDVLRDPATVERVRDYYDPLTDYAGATFVWAEPVDANSFTAADLFALTLLSVDAPSPRVSRLILGLIRGEHDLGALLRSPELPWDLDLAYADGVTLQAMADLYGAVKSTLGNNPWVTAGKLCARKRPRLFPVRDRLVCGLLGITRYRNYEVDWQVFRAVMQDAEIMAALDGIQVKVKDHAVIDPYPLRWLDVALWTYAKSDPR